MTVELLMARGKSFLFVLADSMRPRLK